MGVRSHGHGHGHTHDVEEPFSEEGEAAKTRITGIGAGVNVALAALKAGAGVAINSPVLLADAAHSLTDLVSDAITLVGSKMGAVPPDAAHTYGHGRLETVATLSVAGLLVATGGGIAVHGMESLMAFGAGGGEEVGGSGSGGLVGVGMAAAVVSIAGKEWLFRATKRVADAHSSELLLANAWHHRTDALSSVVAVVGLGGVGMGLPVLDPLGSLLVAGMIVNAGGGIAVSATRDLLDANPLRAAEVSALVHAMSAVPGVEAVADVRHRRLGSYLVGDASVQVAPAITISEAHAIAARAQEAAMATLPALKDMVIHVEPVGMVDSSADRRPSHSVFPSTLPLEELKELVERGVPAAVRAVESVSHVDVHVIDSSVIELTVTVVLSSHHNPSDGGVEGGGVEGGGGLEEGGLEEGGGLERRLKGLSSDVKQATLSLLSPTTSISCVDVHIEAP